VTQSPVSVRRADAADRGAVLDLLAASLGWDRDARFAEFFSWKHEQNPFGVSPGWVAIENDRVVGFRTFLQWRFEHPDGRTRRAVRAVDTATAPDAQGRGVFRTLTLAAIDEMRVEGVDLVFNTPNTKSRPGYLKMGWSEVGRAPAAVRIANLRGARRMLSSRVAADRWPSPITAGAPAPELLADTRVKALLDHLAPATGYRTARTPEYLRWRYGHEPLGYRALAPHDDPGEGVIVFRVRRRGRATEAAICDVLVPGDAPSTKRALMRRVARTTGNDYAILIGAASPRAGFVPAPRLGPIVTWRPLAADGPVPARRDLDLSLGDVELF
jgi:GNAT superfamily N-acetyltransferase